jgi:catechol 2,3-dioxygenase-like lactoylglutathione lyase family enzyme
MAELPPPREGIVLAHFSVADDVERSRRFYTEVLGGRVGFSGPGGPTNVALSNTWVIINGGGGPTDDSRRLPWGRHATPTGSAASSISGSKTSRPCTAIGAPGVLSS